MIKAASESLIFADLTGNLFKVFKGILSGRDSDIARIVIKVKHEK